jgi:hypothetical protein
MPAPTDDELLKEQQKAERTDGARQRRGNPDKAPSANAGNVGLGAADDNKAPRKPGSEI